MPNDRFIDVIKTCIQCKESKKLTVSKTGYQNWKDGTYIQEALPELSADDRELLISGVCGTCFDEMYQEECGAEKG